MRMTHDDVAALLARVPQWAGAEIRLHPLHGGITNTNWVAEVGGRQFVARVPGERTDML
jgi:hypothetical protein